MCLLITTTLTVAEIPPSLRAIVNRRGFRFGPFPNASIARQLEPGEVCFQATGGMCDCGSELGIGPSATSNEDELAREVRKLKKKGWGQAKIARWLAEHEKNAKAAPRKALHRMQSPSIDQWIQLIRELLETGEISSVGILLHFYEGDFFSEEVEVCERRTVSFDRVDREYLLRLDRDVLYEMRRLYA